MVLMVGSPQLAQVFCSYGGLGLSQCGLAGLNVLKSVGRIVLEGRRPARLAKDFQGVGQGSSCHRGRCIARAAQIKKPELQKKTAAVSGVST